jgi:hypothetical protein
LKGDHPRTIPAKFALIWFSGFRGEDLNVIFYQNMPNLYNQYKSVERKNSQKNPEYMLMEYYEIKITSKSFAQKFELGASSCLNLTSFPTFLTLQDKHNIQSHRKTQNIC